MTTMLATVDTTGTINGSTFIAVDETRDEMVVASPWSRDLTATEIEDGEWDAILAEAGWTVTTDWEDHNGYWTAEVERAIRHFADASWDSETVVVYADPDDESSAAAGALEWVDPDDDSTAADDRRRQVITDALAALGFEPIPGEEWQHVEGGLDSEAGAERVPVQPLTRR